MRDRATTAGRSGLVPTAGQLAGRVQGGAVSANPAARRPAEKNLFSPLDPIVADW